MHTHPATQSIWQANMTVAWKAQWLMFADKASISLDLTCVWQTLMTCTVKRTLSEEVVTPDWQVNQSRAYENAWFHSTHCTAVQLLFISIFIFKCHSVWPRGRNLAVSIVPARGCYKYNIRIQKAFLGVYSKPCCYW